MKIGIKTTGVHHIALRSTDLDARKASTLRHLASR